MIELEVLDDAAIGVRADALRELSAQALAAAGINDGHVAIHFVSADAIRALNAEHRGRDEPTDVLAFPVDGPGPAAGPRLLGDVVICPAMVAGELSEVLIHGLLHLAGMDHEADQGEMIELQRRLTATVAPPSLLAE